MGTNSLLNPFVLLVCCRSDEAAFQTDWIMESLSVTWIGLVIVLLTKQRITALSPSDKK